MLAFSPDHFRKGSAWATHAGRDALGVQFFSKRLFLSGLDYGLVSWRRACYWLVRLFLILVDSPRDRRVISCSGNRGFRFGIGRDYGRFFCKELAKTRDVCLVRVDCFFPGGPAIAAVVVSESSVRLRTGVDAGAYASAYGASMAHTLLPRC